MAKVKDREELERRLARRVGKELAGEMKQLLDYLGDPPDWNKVPQEFWDESTMGLRGAVGPIMEEIYILQAETLLDEFGGLGVDWDLVNRAAADWARAHSKDLCGKLVLRSYEDARIAVADFYEQGLTMGDLYDRLGRIYGPKRAENIAITEVTRAATEGERGIVDELSKLGIVMKEFWATENDDLVCTICGPRNEKEIGDGWTRGDGPPAHPKCRCWVNHELSGD